MHSIRDCPSAGRRLTNVGRPRAPPGAFVRLGQSAHLHPRGTRRASPLVPYSVHGRSSPTLERGDTRRVVCRESARNFFCPRTPHTHTCSSSSLSPAQPPSPLPRSNTNHPAQGRRGCAQPPPRAPLRIGHSTVCSAAAATRATRPGDCRHLPAPAVAATSPTRRRCTSALDPRHGHGCARRLARPSEPRSRASARRARPPARGQPPSRWAQRGRRAAPRASPRRS
jgi:hypothetical protein